MKRSVSARLMIAISVLVATAGPAAAAFARPAAGATVETGSATSATAVPEAATVPASALRVFAVGAGPHARGFSVSVNPGVASKGVVVVTNHSSNLRLTVDLAPVDASKRGGALRFANSASPTGPASWLTLSDLAETLEPKASVSVSVSVLAPANSTPGAFFAGMRVRVEQAVRTSDGASVEGNPSVSLPIAITINAAATALVSIATVRAVETHGQNFLDIQFQNAGATAMVMRGQLRVAGAQPRTYVVVANVAPIKGTTVQIPWAKPVGSKGVPVSVETQGAHGDQASWNGILGGITPTTVPARTTSRGGVPIVARDENRPSLLLIGLGAAVLAAVIWFLYEVRRARARRRRRRARLIPEPAAVVATGAAVGVASTGLVGAPGLVATRSDEHVSAVAAQLAALVGAIDRLAGRLDGVPVLAAAPSPVTAPVAIEPFATPAVAAPALVTPALATPALATPAVAVPARPARLATESTATKAPLPTVPPVTAAPPVTAPPLTVPSAPIVEGEQYPYDWPTEEQLDRFVERRQAASTDPT